MGISERFLRGYQGPYGGTKESEFWRPVKMALASVVVVTIMLLALVLMAIAAGDFVGPILLIGATLLITAKRPVGIGWTDREVRQQEDQHRLDMPG